LTYGRNYLATDTTVLVPTRTLGDASYPARSTSKKDTINCAGDSQIQLPRAELYTAGLLVLLEEL
jgi:hypothetical protein